MSTWVLCGPETKPNVSSSVAHFAASYRYCVIVCVCVCNVPCLHESISSKPVVTWLYSSHYGLLSMYWNAGVVRNVIDVCKVAWQERQKKRQRRTQDALVCVFLPSSVVVLIQRQRTSITYVQPEFSQLGNVFCIKCCFLSANRKVQSCASRENDYFCLIAGVYVRSLELACYLIYGSFRCRGWCRCLLLQSSER